MSSTKVYTLAEIAEHKVANSYWLAIGDYVYDVTQFMDKHPGGRAILTKHSGTDVTVAFDAVNHSTSAKKHMEQFKIGELAKADRDKRQVAKKALPKYTMFEVSNKRGPDSYWFVLSNMVLDVTAFGGDHPGGPEIIKYHSGTDATVAFKNNGHSMEAVEMSKKFIIGELVEEDRVQYEGFKTNAHWNDKTVKKEEDPAAAFFRRQLSYLFVLILVIAAAYFCFA